MEKKKRDKLFKNNAQRIGAIFDNKYVTGIRQGFLYMMPLIVIGSLIVAFLNLPIPAFQNFMIDTFGEDWKNFALIMHKATLQVMSLTATIAIGYALANQEKIVEEGRIKAVYASLVAFSSYVAFMKPTELVDTTITTEDAGSISMFTALLISIISVKLLFMLYGIYDKYFPSKEHKYNGNVETRISFHVLPPMFVTILIFAIANHLIHVLGVTDKFFDMVSHGFELLFLSDNLGSVILIILVTQLLWFCGIHGGNVFLEAFDEATQTAAAHGDQITHFSKEFFDIFVYFGGAGSTLALVLALILFGENSSDKKVAKSAAIPGILNINEPIIYGLPIIFNPFYFIPFLLAPILVAIVSYGAVTLGIVPMPTIEIDWTTPIFLSGFLATKSLSAVLLQIVCFSLALVVYLPFVILSKENAEESYKKDFSRMTKEMRYIQNSKTVKIITRSDEVGSVARYLASEINEAVHDERDLLHLEYQPKVLVDGRVYGAEALLRWNHETFGYVSPLTILNIADEAEISNQLGRWVIKNSLKDKVDWIKSGYNDLSLSINLSPMQLNTDSRIAEYIKSQVEQRGLDPRLIEFELTENATIEHTEDVFNALKIIRETGFDISIDDFGMGHSSLKYLYDFFANVVKIDASLVQAVTKGEDRKMIVKAILDLCNTLDVKVVAEGVETKEQLVIMNKLGADRFQGWYFSKALTSQKFIEYIERVGCVPNL